MADLKVGQVVELKSGGPSMTVDQVGDDGQVYCKWFSKGQLSSEWFISDSLEPSANGGNSVNIARS